MHEFSLALEILHTVENAAKNEGFETVKSITLEIGELAGVESDALEFALTHIAPGSLLESAHLYLEKVEGSGYCPECAHRIRLEYRFSPCPNCGQSALILIEGTELRVRHLEVI